MTPQLIIINTAEGVADLQAYLADKDIITYDTETTGVTRRDEIIGYSVCAEEDRAYYVILSKWNKEAGKLIYLETKEASEKLIESLKGKSLVMHNAVFDCSMTESFFKISLIESLHTDTMILAHLLNENRRVGLKDLGREYFGEESTEQQRQMKESVLANGGKLTKSEYEMYKADSHLMAKYGAQDALLTYNLFMKLVPELYEQGLDKFFYEEESMPLLRSSTYELNSSGLQVDTKFMAALKKQLEGECLEAKAFIDQEIASKIKTKYPGTNKKNTFNIGSSQQLAWLLFDQCGLEFGTLTDGGKAMAKFLNVKVYTPKGKRDFITLCKEAKDQTHQPEATVNGKKVRAKKVKDPWAYIAVDKGTLKKLAPQYKWIERLLEYQRKTKILSTYLEGIESRTQYGVIYPSFLQHGTTSGRYSSRNPNFQNLPRDDKRVKECIVARPGKVFVGADYSQLEPRVFAYMSQDKNLMAAFNNSEDFYSVIGIKVFGKFDAQPFKEGSPDAFGVKYKALRDLSKVIALASTYGATAHQLAPTTGKSTEDTEQIIADYFEEFPLVAKMMTDSHEIAKRDGQVTNLFGRPRRMPEATRINKIYGPLPHAELPYEARNILNLAQNHRVQSTGASIVNRAAIALKKNLVQAGIDCKLVCQVHDSLVIECRESDAENVALLMQSAMEDTTLLPGVPLEAAPKVGKNLAQV